MGNAPMASSGTFLRNWRRDEFSFMFERERPWSPAFPHCSLSLAGLRRLKIQLLVFQIPGEFKFLLGLVSLSHKHVGAPQLVVRICFIRVQLDSFLELGNGRPGFAFVQQGLAQTVMRLRISGLFT